MNLKHVTNTLSLLQEQKKMALNKSQNFSWRLLTTKKNTPKCGIKNSLASMILPKTWKLLQMIKTTNGQICTLNSSKQPKNKDSLNLLKNSSWLLKLKSITKNAIDLERARKIVRCHSCDAQSAQMVGANKINMAIAAWNKRVGEAAQWATSTNAHYAY